jgi:hypothetical protein
MRLKKWLPKFGSPRDCSYIDDIEIKVMLKKIDVRFLIGAVISFTVAGLIINGKTGIAFADPLNEMLTFALACVMGIVCLAGIKK